jgi:preprotein translocase subunit YajC
MSIVLIPALLILFYFVFLRPQQQRLRKQRDVMGSLEVGDEVVTAGGMIGQIIELGDERAMIEVADGVEIEFLRAAISRKVEPSSRAYYDPDESEPDDDVESHEDAGPHDAANHDAANHDAANHDAANHDAANHDAANHDAANHDTVAPDAAPNDGGAHNHDGAPLDAAAPDSAVHDPTGKPTGQSAVNQKNHPASEGSETPEQDKQ